MKRKILIATAVAAGVVAVWGETFVSSKILLDHGLRPADIFVFRFILAYAGMWLLCLKSRILFCRNLKDELLMAALGLTGGSLYFLTENTALAHSTASNVAIILSVTPLATAFIMALFYKDERMSPRQIAGSVVALAGLVLIIFNGEVILKLNPLGDLLAFGAVFCWGIYSLLMKSLGGRYDVIFTTRKIFGYGLLTILPYFALNGFPKVASTGILEDPVVWGNLLYLGIIASLGCFVAWNWALSVAGTVRTTNLIYLQPFFTMLISYMVLGERITWMAIAGALVLALGMSLQGR